MTKKPIFRYSLFVAFMLFMGSLFIFSVYSGVSAQWAVREPFTSSLNGWTVENGASNAVVWQSVGTSGSYYQPDGNAGSALWQSSGGLRSPSISTGGGVHFLHFDWFWTGEPFTVTHGSAVGTGLYCYGDSSDLSQLFVVGVWNSCYIEFNLVNGSAFTHFDATSGALDMVQDFFLYTDSGGGTPASVPGQNGSDGTPVPVTSVSSTPTPSSFCGSVLSGSGDWIQVPIQLGASSTIAVVNDGGGAFHTTGTANYLSSSKPWKVNWVSPFDFTHISGIAFDYSRSPSASYPRYIKYSSGGWGDFFRNSNDNPIVSGRLFFHDDTFNFDGSQFDYIYDVSMTSFSVALSGVGWQLAPITPDISVSNVLLYLDDGTVCDLSPPPPPPPLPPVLGFGADCVFTGTVGISGTAPITVTAPVTVSASLLVGGGFENSPYDLNTPNDLDYWSLRGAASNSLPPLIVSGGDVPYDGLYFYVAYHDQWDYTPNYVCQSIYVPPRTDVLEFGGAFRLLTNNNEIMELDVGFGINEGVHQAFVLTTHSQTSAWGYDSARINAGGQSSLIVCVDYEGSGFSNVTTHIDALSVYALDRPDGVPPDDFDNLGLICPDPDLVEDEAISNPFPSSTATPDIFGAVTPVVLGTPHIGGLPTMPSPIGVTPRATRCYGWSELELEAISQTVPSLSLCLEPNELDLTVVDDSVPLPFSFSFLSNSFLLIAVAFAVVGLVKNR